MRRTWSAAALTYYKSAMLNGMWRGWGVGEKVGPVYCV
ncbi:unnamed protein product [Rhodiola kirilowii]